MKRLVATYVILGILPFLTLATPLLSKQAGPTPVLAKTVATAPVITRIIIPKLTTDLMVKPAPIQGDTWQTFDDAAGLAQGTPQNNLVIFAHAKPQMFRALGSLEINDPIYLLNYQTYQEYQVINRHWVNPSDVDSVLSYQSYKSYPSYQPYPTLTLFTCDGYNDESRVVIKAILKGGEI